MDDSDASSPPPSPTNVDPTHIYRAIWNNTSISVGAKISGVLDTVPVHGYLMNNTVVLKRGDRITSGTLYVMSNVNDSSVEDTITFTNAGTPYKLFIYVSRPPVLSVTVVDSESVEFEISGTSELICTHYTLSTKHSGYVLQDTVHDTTTPTALVNDGKWKIHLTSPLCVGDYTLVSDWVIQHPMYTSPPTHSTSTDVIVSHQTLALEYTSSTMNIDTSACHSEFMSVPVSTDVTNTNDEVVGVLQLESTALSSGVLLTGMSLSLQPSILLSGHNTVHAHMGSYLYTFVVHVEVSTLSGLEIDVVTPLTDMITINSLGLESDMIPSSTLSWIISGGLLLCGMIIGASLWVRVLPRRETKADWDPALDFKHLDDMSPSRESEATWDLHCEKISFDDNKVIDYFVLRKVSVNISAFDVKTILRTLHCYYQRKNLIPDKDVVRKVVSHVNKEFGATLSDSGFTYTEKTVFYNLWNTYNKQKKHADDPSVMVEVSL
jgi:hypothetical protein